MYIFNSSSNVPLDAASLGGSVSIIDISYDGEYVVSFDDEVGAHGSLGGEQFYPFIILPKHCLGDGVEIKEPRDIYFKVFSRYRD